MIVKVIGASQDAKLHPHTDPYRGFKELAWDPIQGPLSIRAKGHQPSRPKAH